LPSHLSKLGVGLPLAKESECDGIVNQVRHSRTFCELLRHSYDQVLTWYRASVRVLNDDKKRMVEVIEKQELEKTRMIEEKERVITEKERVIAEKERVIAEKERVIEAKDEMIVEIRESSDIAKALTEIVQKPKLIQKWGER
jgi:hypothetical protein